MHRSSAQASRVALSRSELSSLREVRGMLECRFGLNFPSFHDDWLYSQICHLSHERGLASVGLLKDFLNSRGPEDDAWMDLLHAVTVHETYFYRNGPTAEKALKSLGQSCTEVNFLSVGCSYGHEVYTAFLIARSLYPGISVKGTGIDISRACIDVASAGEFPVTSDFAKLRTLLNANDYCETGGSIRFSPTVHEHLTFKTGNALDPDICPEGVYQVIFCQNCLTYYDEPTRMEVAERLANKLDAGGLLVFAGAELIGNRPRSTVSLSNEWPQILVKEF